METRVYREDAYWVIEVFNENGETLVRLGCDHEPTQEDIDLAIKMAIEITKTMEVLQNASNGEVSQSA